MLQCAPKNAPIDIYIYVGRLRYVSINVSAKVEIFAYRVDLFCNARIPAIVYKGDGPGALFIIAFSATLHARSAPEPHVWVTTLCSPIHIYAFHDAETLARFKTDCAISSHNNFSRYKVRWDLRRETYSIHLTPFNWQRHNLRRMPEWSNCARLRQGVYNSILLGQNCRRPKTSSPDKFISADVAFI